MSTEPSFPTQELLFFVAQDLSNEIRSGVENLVANLGLARSWVIGPPKFVDIAEGLGGNGSNGDEVPFETVGGVLTIYSALSSPALPREIDLQHLEEVSFVIDAVRRFSLKADVAFEFELDGGCAGDIKEGKMSRELADGFLGEWGRHLGVSN